MCEIKIGGSIRTPINLGEKRRRAAFGIVGNAGRKRCRTPAARALRRSGVRRPMKLIIRQGENVESACLGRAQLSTGRRGKVSIPTSAVYQTFNFDSVIGCRANRLQLSDPVVEPESGLRSLWVGDPDQVIVTVTVDVLGKNAPRLRSSRGKMQSRYL